MQQEPTSFRVKDPGVRDVFSEAWRIQSWLDVEVALAKAQAELDVIPQYAANEIASKAKFENLNMDNIYEGLARTGHPLVPMIWEFDRICEGDAGIRFQHSANENELKWVKTCFLDTINRRQDAACNKEGLART